MDHTRPQLPIDPPYTAYISGLPKDTNSVDVLKIFNYQGVRDVRFANNNKDVLTCYVEFKTLERLRLAVAMEGVTVKGLPVQIAVARDLDICRSFDDRKPYPRKAPFVAYVGNLRDDVDYDDIHQIFGAYNVKSIVFMHDLSRQVCYVEFKTLEDLMNAVQLTRIKIRGLKAVIDVGQRIDVSRDCAGFIKQPTSLYPAAPPFTAFVGNLPRVFQGDVLRIFCHQNVKNTTFVKNNDSGEFKNCCFVEFETLDDLKEAVKMNGRVHVNNQVIRINLPGDRGRGGGDRNRSKILDRLDVHIGDLPHQVRHVFNQQNIRKIKFVMDNDSKQFKGSCFVQFRTLEDLEEAVRWDGGVDVEGLMIKITVADHSAIDINGNRIEDVKVPVPTEPPYVAHVSNLPASFVRHNVASVFKNQNVQSVRFSVDKKTKRSNEVCSVKFERTKDVDKTVKMDGVISVRGRTVTMDIAKNFAICRDSVRFPTAPPFTAFVAGLPDRTVASDIRKMFHKQNVKKVRLMLDKDTNRFRNFGFVEFETLTELKEVVNMNGTLIVDGLKITIRIAKPQADNNI